MLQCWAGTASVRFSTQREVCLGCVQSRNALEQEHLLWLITCYHIQVSFGESHKVVGGHPSLGDWDVSNAPQMQWSDGNVWTLEVQLPEGSDIEFKVPVSNAHLSSSVL